MAHAFNPSSWEAEAGEFLFEANLIQGYTDKPQIQKKKKKKSGI